MSKFIASNGFSHYLRLLHLQSTPTSSATFSTTPPSSGIGSVTTAVTCGQLFPAPWKALTTSCCVLLHQECHNAGTTPHPMCAVWCNTAKVSHLIVWCVSTSIVLLLQASLQVSSWVHIIIICTVQIEILLSCVLNFDEDSITHALLLVITGQMCGVQTYPPSPKPTFVLRIFQSHSIFHD